MNVMRLPAVGRNCDGPGLAAAYLHALRFDQRIEHEGAPRLSLAVEAMAAVDEHRLRGEPIAQRATGAASFKLGVQGRSPPGLSRRMFGSRSGKINALASA